MKVKYEFGSAVAETLLIPLYMRAKESRRAGDAVMRDPMAERLADSIDYDYSKFDGASLSAIGCVVRGKYFDDAVRRFVASHPSPVAVNVGCGLDIRCQRIGDGRALFYELDLPEVMELRSRLIPESEGDRYISASLLESGWMDDLRRRHPDSQFIFVIEGVVMYFREEQVRELAVRIADRFAGGELWFDVCGPLLAKSKCVKPDSLRGSEAQIRSGIADGHDVEKWHPRLRLIDQGIYQRMYPERWGAMGRLLGRFPSISRKFSSLLGYAVTDDATPELGGTGRRM